MDAQNVTILERDGNAVRLARVVPVRIDPFML